MNDIYFAIIPGTFVAFLIIFGICLIFGKGGILIPGYNHKAKGANAVFFEKIYCKHVGIVVLVSSVLFSALFTGLVMKINWLTFTSGGVGVCVIFCMLVALKNNKKANIAILLAKELTKNPNCLTEEEIKKYKNEVQRNRKIK